MALVPTRSGPESSGWTLMTVGIHSDQCSMSCTAAQTRSGGAWISIVVWMCVIEAPSRALTRQCRFDPSQMVVTVPHRMILQEELASEWSVTVERHRRRAVELFVGRGPDCRGRRRAVGFQQCECGFFGDVVVLFCMVSVDRIDRVPRHPRDRLAGSEQTRKLDLNWVHTGDVVYNHPDFPSVLGQVRLPLRLRERGRKSSKSCRSVLKTGGKGFRPLVQHCPERRRLGFGDLFMIMVFHSSQSPLQRATVTRRKVAGIRVPSLVLLL